MQSVMMIIVLVGNVGCVGCDLEFCELFALQVIIETNFVVIYYFTSRLLCVASCLD
jgi:hypothetical protein